MFSVCVVVVVHGHEYVHCFGNPAHPRIHLYKKDALTHFDALVPAPGSGDDAVPAPASAIVEVASSSDHHSVTISPKRIVIEETSSDDNDVPLVLPPHPYGTRRSTARMQTGQVSSKRPNQGSSSSSSSTSEEEQVPYTTVYHHTPPCTMLTVFFQKAPPNPHLMAAKRPNQGSSSSSSTSEMTVGILSLHVGLKIEPAANTPEAEVKHAFLSNGHSPILRNSRPGNIRIICKPGKKNCTAVCGVSRNQRDGWYVTYCDVAVGSRCPHAGTELLDAAASLAAGMVVVYGGVCCC